MPLECTTTNLIPDMCIFWKKAKKLIIFELTVPFDLKIDDAHLRKCNKYNPLVSDIEKSGYEVSLVALEVGSRGYISGHNSKRIKDLLKVCNNPIPFKEARDKISKIAVLSSFSIYHAKDEKSWGNFPLLNVQ